MTVVWTPKDDGRLRTTQPEPQQYDKEVLRERFARVIMLAGYKGEAVIGILDDWFEKYMAGDLSEFVKMLEEYERTHGDPD